MAQRIAASKVSVPADTAQASPQTSSIAFAPATVERVEVYIPSGHAGLTGFQLAIGGQPIIPETAGEFISGDDDYLVWPLEDYPNSGAWQCRAFNADVYAHAFHFRFLLRNITREGSGFQLLTPLSI